MYILRLLRLTSEAFAAVLEDTGNIYTFGINLQLFQKLSSYENNYWIKQKL